jgi:inorganic triphosphatase YgiF
MPTVRSEVKSDLTSTYYDTPDLALNRKLPTLRVRKQGRKFLQTVKAGDLAGPDLLARREWEDRIPSRWPDIELTHRRLESGCPTQSASRICASLHDVGQTDGNRKRTASDHAN